MYVDELVTADVVNTMPAATLAAVADHSSATGTDMVRDRYSQAQQVIEEIQRLGVRYDEILQELETAGVNSFIASWQELLATVDNGLQRASGQGAGATGSA